MISKSVHTIQTIHAAAIGPWKEGVHSRLVIKTCKGDVIAPGTANKHEKHVTGMWRTGPGEQYAGAKELLKGA